MNSVKTVRSFFSGMKALDISEYALVAITAASIPFSWWVATRALMLLILNTIIKCIAYKSIGNKVLPKWAKWSLWMLVAYYLLYVLSLAYTSNMDDGTRFLVRKLPLLAFPLCVLCSNTAYMDNRRLRGVMYFFTASLVVKFLIRLAVVLITQHKIKFGPTFDPIHHTYMAMYMLLALGFVYSEWCRLRRRCGVGLMVAFLATALCLVADIVFVSSRTGIAGLAVMAFLAVGHQIFILHNVRESIIAIVVVAVVGAAVFVLLPKQQHRLTKTLTEVSKGDHTDVRFLIMSTSWEAISENMPFGVGVGDRTDVLREKYENMDKEKEYNPHNTYFDSLLTVGIPGLALFLALLILPIAKAFKRMDLVALAFFFTFTFSSLFEAILDRQMGIMFFGLFYVLFCAATHSEPDALLEGGKEE